MGEYRLAPAAERDLERIWEYTIVEWSAAQAERYTETLLAAFQDLADDPTGLRSVACDHVRRGYRRRQVGRHVVYFRAEEYGVAIVRVLHERMDAPRHFE